MKYESNEDKAFVEMLGKKLEKYSIKFIKPRAGYNHFDDEYEVEGINKVSDLSPLNAKAKAFLSEIANNDKIGLVQLGIYGGAGMTSIAYSNFFIMTTKKDSKKIMEAYPNEISPDAQHSHILENKNDPIQMTFNVIVFKMQGSKEDVRINIMVYNLSKKWLKYDKDESNAKYDYEHSAGSYKGD